MQVPAECLTSARRGRAADLRIIFTDNPVPAIFEFLPYRKRDVTASRDEVTYQVFARNG